MTESETGKLWLNLNINVYGYRSMFDFISAIFTKRDNFGNFLFASLDNEAHPEWDQLIKERISSFRSKSFPFKSDP